MFHRDKIVVAQIKEIPANFVLILFRLTLIGIHLKRRV